MNKLTEMRSRYDSGFSSTDRAYIEELYAQLLGKKVRRTGCSDCYRDAFVEIYSYLKRKGRMPKNPNYVLKSGIVIHPAGSTKFYSNGNVPDEVAETYLAKYPNNITEFAVYPADYLTRVEARKNNTPVEEVDPETLRASIQALKDENETLKQNLAEVNSKLEMLGDASDAEAKAKELDAANAKIEKQAADLDAANKEIEALKKQLEGSETTETVKTTETKRTRKVSASAE